MRRAALCALLLVLVAPPALATPQVTRDARVVWGESDPAFGGFSGIEVLEGGARFVAISDRGSWAQGTMQRSAGRLIGVETTGIGPLRAMSGEPLSGEDVDAEGLAVDSTGAFLVSFEAFHRIRRHVTIDAPAEDVPSPREFRRLQNNSALEALAIDADDVIYAIPERSGALDRPFPVFRFRNGVWDKTLRIPRSGAFLVAGADFGPDGRLYVLERDFSWLSGFATRIRRFVLGPEGFDAGETILETPPGSADNFEGVSVWRDAAGVTRITLIADDNFFPLQSTVIAEYTLTEE